MNAHRNVAALAGAATLLLASCGQGGGGLTGETRTQFVQGAVSSCTTKGATDPSMAGVSQEAISAYCTCSANALADRLSETDIATINADPNKARETMAPRIQAAAQQCKGTLGK